MTRPGIEPQSPGPLVNTLLIVFFSIVEAIEKGAFGSPSIMVANLLLLA